MTESRFDISIFYSLYGHNHAYALMYVGKGELNQSQNEKKSISMKKHVSLSIVRLHEGVIEAFLFS